MQSALMTFIEGMIFCAGWMTFQAIVDCVKAKVSRCRIRMKMTKAREGFLTGEVETVSQHEYFHGNEGGF